MQIGRAWLCFITPGWQVLLQQQYILVVSK
jgi:hypothetical protein